MLLGESMGMRLVYIYNSMYIYMYMELLYIAYQPERDIQERTERYHHLHLRNTQK